MTTYSDMQETEERLERLYDELHGTPASCTNDTGLIRADIERDEALLEQQCAALGMTYVTRDDAIARWESLPTYAEVSL